MVKSLLLARPKCVKIPLFGLNSRVKSLFWSEFQGKIPLLDPISRGRRPLLDPISRGRRPLLGPTMCKNGDFIHFLGPKMW